MRSRRNLRSSHRQESGARQKSKNPVEQVTGRAAARFCKRPFVARRVDAVLRHQLLECDFSSPATGCPPSRVGIRLPRGSTTEYYHGNDPEKLRSFAWFEDNSTAIRIRRPAQTECLESLRHGRQRVGMVQRQLRRQYYRESPADNPRGPKQGEKRVLRGGAWSASDGSCTSWVRNCDQMVDRRVPDHGFQRLPVRAEEVSGTRFW